MSDVKTQIAMRRAWGTWAAGMEDVLGLEPNSPIPLILERASEISDRLALLSDLLNKDCERFGFDSLEDFYLAVSEPGDNGLQT